MDEPRGVIGLGTGQRGLVLTERGFQRRLISLQCTRRKRTPGRRTIRRDRIGRHDELIVAALRELPIREMMDISAACSGSAEPQPKENDSRREPGRSCIADLCERYIVQVERWVTRVAV